MTLRVLLRFRPLQRGFSLIEMLVAVMFIGILSAGMLRIYSSNLAGSQRLNDMIGSQRRGRWALASLQDDVSAIGFFAFVPFNQPTGYSVASGSQEPLMVLPSPTPVNVTGIDPANPGGGLVTAPLAPNPDEFQFVGDLPLPIQATVAGPPTAAVLTVNVQSGNLSEVQPGDIVAVMDASFEQVQVAAVNPPNITVSAAGALTAGVSQAGGYALAPTLGAHQTGAPVAFYRPNVVTRYSIQALAWDPSNAGITIPCLVRQMAPYPSGGTLINWVGVQQDVIAENIDGFNVDLSFDGGGSWLRQGSANWDAIVAKMVALTPGGKSLNPRNPSDPLWFRNFPCMIRMQITSRSATPRAANADVAGTAAYVRRTQTLMVTPRNFGLPL